MTPLNTYFVTVQEVAVIPHLYHTQVMITQHMKLIHFVMVIYLVQNQMLMNQIEHFLMEDMRYVVVQLELQMNHQVSIFVECMLAQVQPLFVIVVLIVILSVMVMDVII